MHNLEMRRMNFVFLCSHDRTMQDIVYKLVPGLQEGECHSTSRGLMLRKVMQSLHFFILFRCSGDKEAEGLLPEARDGGSW